MSQHNDGAAVATTAESALDAGSASDADYLAKLGYKQELDRSLGLFSAFGVQFTSIAIGSATFTTLVVGLGFFGPASFWSFVIGGFLQVATVGLAVAQLVSAYPLAGGVYQITGRITRSTFLAWQTGWWLIVAHTVAVIAVAVSMAPFVAAIFGVSAETPGEQLPWAVGVVAIATVINISGVRIAALMNNIGVVAEVIAVVALVIALLAVKHDTQPLSVLTDTAGKSDINGVFLGFAFAMILPAYMISSFDATGNASEETKNAAKIAPLASILANAAAYVTGIIMILLLLLAIPDGQVQAISDSATPVKDIMNAALGTTFTSIFEAVALLALLATVCMLQLTGARVLWSQARDNQLPGAGWVKKVAKNKAPMNATLIVGGVGVIFGLWSNLLSVLAAMTALAWALAYGVVVTVGLGALLRKRLPKHPISFGFFSPIIFVLAIAWSVGLCLMLIVSDPVHVGFGMLGVVLAGVLIYALIPAKHRGKVAAYDSVAD